MKFFQLFIQIHMPTENLTFTWLNNGTIYPFVQQILQTFRLSGSGIFRIF